MEQGGRAQWAAPHQRKAPAEAYHSLANASSGHPRPRAQGRRGSRRRLATRFTPRTGAQPRAWSTAKLRRESPSRTGQTCTMLTLYYHTRVRIRVASSVRPQQQQLASKHTLGKPSLPAASATSCGQGSVPARQVGRHSHAPYVVAEMNVREHVVRRSRTVVLRTPVQHSAWPRYVTRLCYVAHNSSACAAASGGPSQPSHPGPRSTRTTLPSA